MGSKIQLSVLPKEKEMASGKSICPIWGLGISRCPPWRWEILRPSHHHDRAVEDRCQASHTSLRAVGRVCCHGGLFGGSEQPRRDNHSQEGSARDVPDYSSYSARKKKMYLEK